MLGARLGACCLFLVAYFLPMEASRAGELMGGVGGCEISSCEWKPADCYKPSPPTIYSSTARVSYNRAVRDFNAYLARVQDYKNCVIDQGKADAAYSFPALVTKATQKVNEEVDREARRAREELDLARTRLNR